MLTLLQQIANEAADANPYTGSGQTRRLREELDALPVTTPNPNRWLVTIRLADEELRLGNEAKAISLFTRAQNLLPLAGADQSRLNYNLFRLGVAYMRLGKTQNCALHPTADSCILPIRGDGIHREQNPRRVALRKCPANITSCVPTRRWEPISVTWTTMATWTFTLAPAIRPTTVSCPA